MRGRSRTLAGVLAPVAACVAMLGFAGPASATIYNVDDLDDASDAVTDGVCDATGAEACTLRAAIEEANFASGGDTINIVPAGQIDLTLGSPTISPDVAETITVNGHASGTTIDSDSAARVLSATGPGSVVLNDLSVIGGTTTDNDGGGIMSFGANLTLNRVAVFGNTVNSASGGFGGAGIASLGTGSLTLNDSTVSGNTITGISGIGGGIRAQGPLTLIASTVSGNSTTLDVGGRGGGIDASPFSTQPASITNSTISGNSSGGNLMNNGGGGGVFVGSNVSPLTIVASTIAGNSTTGAGGGIRGFANMNAENSIFALNTAPAGPNCSVNGGPAENNIDEGTDCAFGTTNGNKENVTPTQLGLGALASNGGPTQTRALGSGSVALNAASADCGGLAADQRGISRPQGPSCDIGAFEREVAPPTPPGGGGNTTPLTPLTPVIPAPVKCKKGQKLRKGKCVKKKRKKR